MTLVATEIPHPGDTIVALSSAPGPGARAIVRVSGPRARAVVGAVFAEKEHPSEPGREFGSCRGPTPPAPLPAGRGEDEPKEPVREFAAPGAPRTSSPLPAGSGAGGVGPRHDPTTSAFRSYTSGALRLSGLHSPVPSTLYFFAGPRSYTGQDLAELHLVGSPPVVERLIADLLAAGARPARPGEFTMRAFLAGKKDLPQAEAVQAVIEAGTDADLGAALAQLAGGVSGPLGALRDDLLNLLADVEAALDFADEDITFVTPDATVARLTAAVQQLEAVQAQLDDRSIAGRPVRVALVGLPNAGKSSLFNALSGGGALVSPIAGTTRDYLTAALALGGVDVELVDTAGWQQDASDTIEAQAQRLGADQTARADVVLWCDESGAFDPGAGARLAATGADVLIVHTKGDVSDGPRPAAGVVRCSVRVPSGLDGLRAALAEAVLSRARPPLAPSQSRCRGHVGACLERLREARALASAAEPPELLALALRGALDPLGEMTGAVYTNDLLDRIFSRFCIGK